MCFTAPQGKADASRHGAVTPPAHLGAHGYLMWPGLGEVGMRKRLEDMEDELIAAGHRVERTYEAPEGSEQPAYSDSFDVPR